MHGVAFTRLPPYPNPNPNPQPLRVRTASPVVDVVQHYLRRPNSNPIHTIHRLPPGHPPFILPVIRRKAPTSSPSKNPKFQAFFAFFLRLF
ncbi:hypothetical protein GALMADRAFT_231194 [Galerina marginata CBS 339.88]|uniref:Uncharacterized protein n=1 Tax=Galerina marginata (strain CBS 339.88) TaxID=685588 RepID=A0A067SCD5_GALM3|nr:hypothetical protein GALMADRAFT_231194 [Galerina marginata CBS 339.88]